MENNNDWIEQKSDYWNANQQAWKDALAVYEADLRRLRDGRYLIQRMSGEDERQFEERKMLADFMPIFSIVADTYAGRMLEAERKIKRIWQKEGEERGLGDPMEPGSAAHRLWRSADGGDTSWLTMIEDAIILLVVLKEHYAIVRGPRRRGGEVITESSVRLLEPWAVHDAVYDGNDLAEVKVFHETDVRTTVKQVKDKRQRYTLYTQDGFEVWEKTREGSEKYRIAQQMTTGYGSEEAPFYYYKTDERRQKILPIFRNSLSLRRKPGCNLADKNLVIFNQESERDNILRVGNTPKAQFVGDFKKFGAFLKENNAGSNIWPLDENASREHKFIAPPMDPARIATEVLDKKIEALFLAAFRYYEDAVRGKVRTATEVQQDTAGENGFLNVLATGVDNLENGIGLRLEQIEFPNEPTLWGQFSVRRDKDFAPVDEREETDRALKRYFGQSSPVLTQEAEIALTMRAYQQDGIEADKEAITAEVTKRRGDEERRRRREDAEATRAEALAEADGADVANRRAEIERLAAGVA